MPNYLVQALEELEARLPIVWTDKNITYYDTQGARLNWRVLVEEGRIVPPWVVIMALTAVPDTGGAVNATANIMPVTVFYVRSASPALAEASIRVEEAVYQKMHDLLVDLFPTDPTVFTAFQLIEVPSIDVSPQNPANRVFVEASAPFVAGALSMNVLMGQDQA